MKTLCIPDSQLGIRRYADSRRWKNTVYDHAFDVFEAMVELAILKDAELIVQPGDLLQSVSLDDEGWLRLLRSIERARRHGIKFVLLGGNHDSVKSYERVGTLDALAGLTGVHVINSFRPDVVDFGGFRVGGIPHMKSQDLFLAACNGWDEEVDILLLHCSLGVTERYGPNDMQLPFNMLDSLSSHAQVMFIGHEHQFREVEDGRIFQTGSTMPFSFSEVGQKYALYWTGVSHTPVEKLPITPIIHFKEVEREWHNLDAFMSMLNTRVKWPNHILRFTVTDIPPKDFLVARTMADAVAESSPLPMLFKLVKKGELALESIGIESATFDLLAEWDAYAAELKLSDVAAKQLRGYVEDALVLSLGEDD